MGSDFPGCRSREPNQSLLAFRPPCGSGMDCERSSSDLDLGSQDVALRVILEDLIVRLTTARFSVASGGPRPKAPGAARGACPSLFDRVGQKQDQMGTARI